MKRSKHRVDYKTLHLTEQRVIKSQLSEEISQEQYSFPKLTSNQSKSLSSIGISNTEHLSTTSITPTASSTSLQNTKLILTSASDITSLSTLKSSQNVIIEDSTLTQLSTMFNNCSIKESNIAEENKFEGIHQLAAQIATISDDVDDHIDENPIEDICSSIEDLDVFIVKTENLRTQYRSKHQEMRISLGNQYNETYGVNYEEKLSLMKEYIKKAKDARKNMHHQESSQKEVQKQKQTSSLDFSLKCVADMMDNLKIQFAKSFENTRDEEVSRLSKEQPKQSMNLKK